MRCLRCNGSLLKEDKEIVCINCGWVVPDKFTKEFMFNPKANKYEERYKEELVSKALLRHKE